MIKDEKSAPNSYKRLEKHLHPKDRSIIKKIIKQERNHHSILLKLKKGY
jgi:rubrerythrin